MVIGESGFKAQAGQTIVSGYNYNTIQFIVL